MHQAIEIQKKVFSTPTDICDTAAMFCQILTVLKRSLEKKPRKCFPALTIMLTPHSLSNVTSVWMYNEKNEMDFQIRN